MKSGDVDFTCSAAPTAKLRAGWGGVWMRAAIDINARPAINRRSFLFAATATAGAVGAVAAAWPLIDQMNPDAHVRAAAEMVTVDLAALRPAEQRQLRWRGLPVFVVRRTPAMLAAMQQPDFVSRLADPDSQRRQQPPYAANWHRSIDPAFAILIGICTECRCVTTYCAEDSVLAMAGGYLCPCCASHYDPAGRAYSGIARYNLPVPPYAAVGQRKILLGKNPPGVIDSFEAIERL